MSIVCDGCGHGAYPGECIACARQELKDSQQRMRIRCHTCGMWGDGSAVVVEKVRQLHDEAHSVEVWPHGRRDEAVRYGPTTAPAR